MQLDGKIIAPTSSEPWGSGLLQWLEFKTLTRLGLVGWNGKNAKHETNGSNQPYLITFL